MICSAIDSRQCMRVQKNCWEFTKSKIRKAIKLINCFEILKLMGFSQILSNSRSLAGWRLSLFKTFKNSSFALFFFIYSLSRLNLVDWPTIEMIFDSWSQTLNLYVTTSLVITLSSWKDFSTVDFKLISKRPLSRLCRDRRVHVLKSDFISIWSIFVRLKHNDYNKEEFLISFHFTKRFEIEIK